MPVGVTQRNHHQTSSTMGSEHHDTTQQGVEPTLHFN
jgi:hypothetical protein